MVKIVKIIKYIWLVVALFTLINYIYLAILVNYYDQSLYLLKSDFVLNTILSMIVQFPIAIVFEYIRKTFLNYCEYPYVMHIIYYIVVSIFNYIFWSFIVFLLQKKEK